MGVANTQYIESVLLLTVKWSGNDFIYNCGLTANDSATDGGFFNNHVHQGVENLVFRFFKVKESFQFPDFIVILQIGHIDCNGFVPEA